VRIYNLKESRDSLIAEIEDSLRTSPNSAMWHYLRGRQEDDLEKRAEFNREGIRLEPDHPWAHYGLGHTLMLEGRYGPAEEELRRALAADSAHLYARSALADLLATRFKRYSEARAELEQVVAASPGFMAGMTQEELERLVYRTMPVDSVVSYYKPRTGLADSTARCYAWLHLGNALRGLGRWGESAGAYEEALKLGPPGSRRSLAAYHLAEMLYRSGDTAGAIAYYDSVLASRDSASYYFPRAEVFRANLADSSRAGRAVLLAVPWEMQDGPTCASACDAMQLTYLGHPTTEEEVIRHVHNKKLGGGTTFNITQYPRRFGYLSRRGYPTAAGYLASLLEEVNEDKLREAKRLLDAGIPLQTFIQYEQAGHAIVLVGYDDRKGAVVIHNPQARPGRNIFEEIPYREFSEMWRTAGYMYSVMVPAEKKHEVPLWGVGPVLSLYPVDVPEMAFGTSLSQRSVVRDLHGSDLYATQHHFESVTAGVSLDYFGDHQRLWSAVDYRWRDEAWRYEMGFHNWSLPSARLPLSLSGYSEEGLWGWSVISRPFSSITLGMEADYVDGPDVEVMGLAWDEGTDVRVLADYWYGEVAGMLKPRGWAAGLTLSGAREFLGGDYDYGKTRVWASRYFGLPLNSTLKLAPVLGWIRGAAPVQSRFSPVRSARSNAAYGEGFRNTGFRNVADDLVRGERMLAASVELSRPILRSTPLHSVIPLTGYLFYDIAYTWPATLKAGEIRFDDFRRSWGCGIHMEFIGLEVAFPADQRDYARTKFYLSLDWRQIVAARPNFSDEFQ
jgi:tetratricopeptide (TPR) repeat protein